MAKLMGSTYGFAPFVGFCSGRVDANGHEEVSCADNVLQGPRGMPNQSYAEWWACGTQVGGVGLGGISGWMRVSVAHPSYIDSHRGRQGGHSKWDNFW